jgi:hypothetical protein
MQNSCIFSGAERFFIGSLKSSITSAKNAQKKARNV